MTSTTFSDKEKNFSKPFAQKQFWTLFRWQLRRCLPLTLLVGAGMTVYAVYDCLIWHATSLYGGGFSAPLIMGTFLAFSALAPMLLFSECFNRKRADVVHALPAKRKTWYFAGVLAGLISELAAFAPCLLTLSATSLAMGTGTLLIFNSSLFLVGGAALLFFSAIAAGSGGLFSYVLNALLLSVCWPSGMECFCTLLNHTIPMGDLLDRVERFLVQMGSPAAGVIGLQRDRLGIYKLAYWAMAAVGLLFLGLWLYSRRESEMTGSARCCKFLETAVRAEAVLAAVYFVGQAVEAATQTDWFPEMELEGGGYAAGNGYIGAWGIPLVLGAMALVLFLAWLLTEFLFHRSIKGLKKHLLSLLLPLGIVVCAQGLVSTGLGLDSPAVADMEGELPYYVFHTDDPLMEFSDSMMVFFGTERAEDPYHTLENHLYSPQAAEKLQKLQETWREMERANQFPYLPGRRAHSMRQGFYVNAYNGGARRGVMEGEYYGRSTERTEALYGECQTLIRELCLSEERVKGAIPVCAVEAVDGLRGQDLTYIEEKSGSCDSEEEYEEYVENTEQIAKLYYLMYSSYDEFQPDKKRADFSGDFIERLEKALTADLENGRVPSYGDRQTCLREKGTLTVYEIHYGRRRFHARGGILNDGERAEGKAMNNDPFTIRVWPQMAETYALLKETLG